MLRSDENRLLLSHVADAIGELCELQATVTGYRIACERQASAPVWSAADRQQWALALVALRTAEQQVAHAVECLAGLSIIETYSSDWGV